MIDSLLAKPSLAAVMLLVASVLAYFSTKLYHARMLVVDLRKKGLPVAPDHNFLFGHLLFLKKYMDALPRGAHYQYTMADIARDHFFKEGAFYIDTWPVSGLLLSVVSPTTGVQATQTNPHLCSQRPRLVQQFMKPIAGGSNLFDLPEKEWKPWRTIFNKGFGNEHILSLVPGMVKEVLVYSETLRSLARKGEMVYLDTLTLRFTMDMIGRTILNAALGAQRGYNTLADCMISQIRWHQFGAEINPFGSLNLARWYVQRSNGRQMDQYIGKELDKRYDEYKSDAANVRSKAVIDLVLQTFIPEEVAEKPKRLDPSFRSFAIRQIRLFLFAGHDSTSSTICYSLYLLSTNPAALARLRAEHDEVLGSDIARTPSLLLQNPSLTNSLPYTTAVLKETMRLFAPASGSREGTANTSVTDDQGNICPTDNAMVYVIHVAMHRAEKYWKRPEEFLPERWLVDPDHELYPIKGAWRPFEHGPRNCIAQNLVMTELRVVLACIVREFDIQPAYEEWDRLHPRRGLKTYRGERVYQVEEGAAHPVEHYPCRVSLRKG